jgi:hypothetical protein
LQDKLRFFLYNGSSMGNFLKNLIIPRYNNNYFPFLLRRPFLAILTIAILGFNIATGGGQLGAFAGDISSSRLIELTNQERAAAGLNQLRNDGRLAAAAQAKANNMFQLQYWSHYGPNGETPWQFILAAGYSYVYAGENLAKGFSSSEAVHSAWMASQTHRENIMKVGYQDIGIAVVEGNLLGSDVVLVVQMFGSLSQTPVAPPSQPAAPPPSGQQQGGIPEPEEEQAFVEITAPTEGERIADNTFTMTGTTNQGATSVIVEDSGTEDQGTVGEDGVWDYRPDGNWTEGMHSVTVSDVTQTVSSSVGFEIDTTPPSISGYSFDTETKADEDVVVLSVETDGTAKRVLLVAGEQSMEFEDDGEGLYSLLVSETDLLEVDTLKLIATDDLGNVSELDLSESEGASLGSTTDTGQGEEGQQGGSGLQSFLSRFVVLDDPSISRSVSRGVVVFVALLLFVDVVYLYRLNIIHSRGKTLFPMALWLILMGVGIAVGKGGSIL